MSKKKLIPKGQKGLQSPSNQGEIRQWNPSKRELFWDKFEDNHREGLNLIKGLGKTVGTSALFALPFMDKSKKFLNYPILKGDDVLPSKPLKEILTIPAGIGLRYFTEYNDKLSKKYDPDNSLWKNIIESKLETDSIPESMYSSPFDLIFKIRHDYGNDIAYDIKDTYLDSLNHRKNNE